MNRMSVSNRSVSTLPSGFLAVPVPCTCATPTWPLKSVIDDGSTPAAKKVTWKSTPLILLTPVVGLGAAWEFQAKAAAGESNPLPSAAPVAAAVPPMKARRENPCRAWCGDNIESNGTGEPLLSAWNACMIHTPHVDLGLRMARSWPARDCNTTSLIRTECSEIFNQSCATPTAGPRPPTTETKLVALHVTTTDVNKVALRIATYTFKLAGWAHAGMRRARDGIAEADGNRTRLRR